MLLNAPQVLQNSRILPNEVRETVAQYRSWVKEDSEWTGYWSANPEGLMDIAEMKLSNVDMQIKIEASQGEIDGTIVTKEICKEIPMFNYVLLHGEVFGNTANVTAWDMVQGHEVNFAQLKLVRDGDVITVTPTAGRKEWFPSKARLGRSTTEDSVGQESDQTFCAPERKALVEKLRLPGTSEG